MKTIHIIALLLSLTVVVSFTGCYDMFYQDLACQVGGELIIQSYKAAKRNQPSAPEETEPWRCNEVECKFETESYDELRMHRASKHPEKYDEQGYFRKDDNEEADSAQSFT